jgi:hypothetical protein
MPTLSYCGVYMSSSLYEIVELPDGDVVLRRIDDEDAEPLVKIHFSEESLNYLGESKFAIARAMIEAGMEAANDETQDDSVESSYEEDQLEGYLLH